LEAKRGCRRRWAPGESHRARIAGLHAALQHLRTLRDALAWSCTGILSRQPTEIVTQDEYTHDVVFRLDDELYLAFDTT
jgi:hypothetical protein